MKIFIFIIICVCSNLANALFAERFDLLNKMAEIPADEQEEIKSLFRHLFINDVFSYSLFGDKPLSCSRSIINNTSHEKLLKLLFLDGYCLSFLECYCEPSIILKKNWEVWCKHKNKFKQTNYFLFQNRIGSQTRLIIINKKSFLKVVNQHITLFKRVMGPLVSAETLLEAMQKEDINIFDTLHNNEGLLGILLGFGKHNSLVFQKREELIDSLGKDLKKIELINNEIDVLNKKLQPLHEYDKYIIATINRVGFSSDHDHPETIQLRSKYDNLNRKINEIYSRDDWFERTLIQLMSD
jgi:hypothetical protein